MLKINYSSQIKKIIQTESNYILNTIECDSFDTKNIFCVYSIIKLESNNRDYSTISSDSCEEINKNHFRKK